MPIISIFLGIKVTINWNDHMPPHFHVEYNDNEAIINIKEISVVKGSLPKRQLKLVLAWAELHKDELMQDWELSRHKQPLNKIEGLR